MPWGCQDNQFPWQQRTGELNETKYAYVVHAELNAILNSTASLDNCRIYVSLFPCNECAKAIVQSGIKEIIYEDDKYKGTAMDIASKRILYAAGVTYRKVPYFGIKVEDEHV